jgi:hypothetical protein
VRGLIKRLKRRFVNWLLDVEELMVPSQLRVGNTISITGDYIDMERLGSDPSTKEGRLYYRSDLKRLRLMDGVQIVELMGVESSTQRLLTDFVGFKQLTADPTLMDGRVFYRSDRKKLRVTDGSSVMELLDTDASTLALINDFLGLKPITSDPSLYGGRLYYRSDLGRFRAMTASKTIELLGIETDTSLLTHDLFRFRALTSEPTVADGMIYYRSDQKILKITDGTRKIGLVPPKVLRVGRWFGSFDAATAFTTITISANTLYATPFFVPEETTFDRIAINVTSAAGSGAKARLGIYEDGKTPTTQGYPAGLVSGTDVAEIAVDTTGVRANTISVTLPPGLYWLALCSDSTPTLRGVGVASLDSEILGLGDDLGTAPGVAWSVSYTFGALPLTFPSGASVYTTTIPLIALRRA